MSVHVAFCEKTELAELAEELADSLVPHVVQLEL